MGRAKSAKNGAGSIFQRTHKRKSGDATKWYAEIQIDNTPYHSPPCDSWDDADKWLAETKTKHYGGDLVAPSRETVGICIDRWLTDTLPLEVGPATERLYRNLFDWYVNKHLGKLRLQELRPEQIRAMLRKLIDSGKSPRTAQLCLILLRRSLRQAVEDGKLAKSPVDAVKPPKAEMPEHRVLTEEQIDAFIEAASSERLHALYVLAITTGMRQGELLALRWGDVSLESRVVTVNRTRKVVHNEERRDRSTFGEPKTRAGHRTIPLSEDAYLSLKKWKTHQGEELIGVGVKQTKTQLVFTTAINTPLHPRNVRDDGFRRICERIGMAERRPRKKPAKDGSVTRSVPLIRFHDLRHSAVTYMLAQGVKPEIVQKVAGHSDITTTLRIYRKVFEEEKKEAAQVFDNLKAARKSAR